MQFMRFIRKVFATKILLSGKFSLFVTLAQMLEFAAKVSQPSEPDFDLLMLAFYSNYE